MNMTARHRIFHTFSSVETARHAFQNPNGPGPYAYDRMGDETVTELGRTIARIEGAQENCAWETHNGISALLFLVLALTSKKAGRGRRVVTSSFIYGGSHHQLSLFRDDHGFDVAFVENPFAVEEWERLITPGTAFVFLETPSNPTVDVFDIQALAALAHRKDTLLIVDNTVGVTLQYPLALGADAVLHSVTKILNGNATALGGAVVCRDDSVLMSKELGAVLGEWFVHSGVIMAHEAAVLTLDHCGVIETLAWEAAEISRNALAMAQWLERHRKVQKVYYPFLDSYEHHALARRQMSGGGGLLSFDVGSAANAETIGDEIIRAGLHFAPHLGYRGGTIYIAPAVTTHALLTHEERVAAHITDGMIRVSVGVPDIAPDLEVLSGAFKNI